jgi:hypothetical protein
MSERSAVVILALLVGCATPPPADEPAETDAAPPAAENAPDGPRLAVLLFGFFNSEDPAGFSPEPIAYASVDLGEAHGRIVERVAGYRFRTPPRLLDGNETKTALSGSRLSRDEARDRLLASVEVLDAAANEQPSTLARAQALVSPALLPEWDDSDLVLSVVALETRLRDGTPRGLRSVLGCFWFTGDGAYAGTLLTPYDFTSLDTDGFVDLVVESCDPFRPRPAP